jgi:hypothetical protein
MFSATQSRSAMSDLTNAEKRKFERLLEMGGGYVLNFLNRTFDEFVTDTISRNIYDSKYDGYGSSKANRLRAFWQAEPNYVVAKLMGAFIDYQKEIEDQNQTSGTFDTKKPEELQQTASLRDECQRIVTRLLQDQPVPELEALAAISDEKDFEVVARAPSGMQLRRTSPRPDSTGFIRSSQSTFALYAPSAVWSLRRTSRFTASSASMPGAFTKPACLSRR